MPEALQCKRSTACIQRRRVCRLIRGCKRAWTQVCAAAVGSTSKLTAEDRLSILELCHRFDQALNEGRQDGMALFFVEEGEVRLGLCGMRRAQRVHAGQAAQRAQNTARHKCECSRVTMKLLGMNKREQLPNTTCGNWRAVVSMVCFSSAHKWRITWQ